MQSTTETAQIKARSSPPLAPAFRFRGSASDPIVTAGDPSKPRSVLPNKRERRSASVDAGAIPAASAAALKCALSRQYDCNDPHVLTSTPAGRATALVTRKFSDCERFGVVESRASDDAFLITVELGDESRRVCGGGACGAEQIYRRDDIAIRSLAQDYLAKLVSPFDQLCIYLPRTGLDAVAEELGVRPISDLASVCGRADPVAAMLARALLPSLAAPESANSRFVDRVVSAITLHVAQRYGGLQTVIRHAGGLARWQEKRALDFLAANGLREISIAQIADECRLSRSYFIKAFKQTLGQTPHRWLMQRRVEKAREMLLDEEASIAQIADACGFVDQSHLTRVFTSAFGMPPGVWRRQYRAAA